VPVSSSIRSAAHPKSPAARACSTDPVRQLSRSYQSAARRCRSGTSPGCVRCRRSRRKAAKRWW
jgi:hypothetical protein